MIEPDKWIREQAALGMLEPFTDPAVRKGAISYGLSHYGYDLKLHNTIKVFRPKISRPIHLSSTLALPQPQEIAITIHAVDPKDSASYEMQDVVLPEEGWLMHPHTVVLGRSEEYIKMPSTHLGVCYGKSTYARCGLVVNITPLEPGWEGYLTIEISNTNALPVILYPEGICQLVFYKSTGQCETMYKDKGGKYQDQPGVTLARVD